MNLALSVAIALVIWVILVPVVLAIRFSLGAPVFFTQQRTGLGGRIFTLCKFRTMIPATENARTDAERLTPLGKFLRRTSIDELPQLWNVLKGDMSLVGPRPLLPQYLPRYTPRQRLRHEVRPGITGWAQIHGRNRLSWEEKFEYDVWYVDHRSLWLDLKILALTVQQVLRRDGISQPGHATAQEFLGTEEKSPAK
jgi:sugar transferase EpsL